MITLQRQKRAGSRRPAHLAVLVRIVKLRQAARVLAGRRAGDSPLSVRVRPSSLKHDRSRRATRTSGNCLVNVHAKSCLILEPLRPLRSRDKGQAAACPDRGAGHPLQGAGQPRQGTSRTCPLRARSAGHRGYPTVTSGQPDMPTHLRIPRSLEPGRRPPKQQVPHSSRGPR
jgi:hypothetical protein